MTAGAPTIPPGAVIAPHAARSEAGAGLLHRQLTLLGEEGAGLVGAGAVAGLPSLWTRRDAQAAARAVASAGDGLKPFVVEGLSTDLLELLLEATPSRTDAYSARAVFVEPDAGRALGVLAERDVSAALRHPRFKVFVGPGAVERVGAWLNGLDALRVSLPDRVLRPPTAGGGPARVPGLEGLLASAAAAQAALHESLRRSVWQAYAARSRESWRTRFASGERLKVLIPISRFSTFVRHSAEDLAGALRRAGHEALVLTEPDAHSKLASPAYLEAFDTFEPDLVVLINFTRQHMGQAVPPGVPFVCWVQDRMAHLFDPACGAAQGDLDFLIGHMHADLFDHFNYPRKNRRFRFVPACPVKFHGGPIAPGLMARLACDVSYASHQSETPERFHERTAPMFGSVANVRAALEPLRAAASRWMDDLDGSPSAVRPARVDLVREALAGAGMPRPDERLVMTVFGNYLVPLMERMLRHRTLEWAAAVCRRRGWSLRLFGRGWVSHPTLSVFAGGAIDHEEDALRSVYRASRVNLHLSLNTNSHQRVMECALSGGLMIRRGPSPDWELAKTGLMSRAAEGWVAEREGEMVTRCWTDEGGLILKNYWRQRGIEPAFDDHGRPVFRRRLAEGVWERHRQTCPHMPLESMPDYAFPDAHETLFSSEAELEAVIERALSDEPWRERTIAAHRRVASEQGTVDAFAAALLGLVRKGLGVVVPAKEAPR
ncbi:MAG: hypothetical protein J0L61_03105 [Planctomycetes bacterium]|nr:hypothetical protein [Planctomycetota bacterium]